MRPLQKICKHVYWGDPSVEGGTEAEAGFQVSRNGVSQNQGYHFGGPSSKECSILGSLLGSPYLGKL